MNVIMETEICANTKVNVAWSLNCNIETQDMGVEERREFFTELQLKHVQGDKSLIIAGDAKNIKIEMNDKKSDEDGNCSDPFNATSYGFNVISEQKIESCDEDTYPESQNGIAFCEMCCRLFKNQTELGRHSCIELSDKAYICDMCKKSFLTKRDLLRHLRIHTGDKPYSCNICNKTFSQKPNVVRHMRIHTRDLTLVTDEPGLARKIVSTEEKAFPCEVCDKAFSRKRDLLAHGNIHTGHKPHTCIICNRSFTQKPTLWRHHIRVHTDARPFRCEICLNTFSMKGDFLRHTRVHSGEKPFFCNVCNKAFSQKPNLLRHMQVHTGEKPFACEICNEVFSQKHTLIRHQIRVHTPSTFDDTNIQVTETTSLNQLKNSRKRKL